MNPAGGRDIFVPEEFNQLSIELEFLEHNLPAYSQGDREFIGGLSIIDVLMFMEGEPLREMLSDYRVC